MKLTRTLPYVALGGATIAVLIDNPRSWVLIPLALVLGATAAWDILRARRAQ